MHNKGACDLMLQELKRRVEEAEALLREASDLVENVEIVVPYDCRERNALIRKIDVLLAAVRK
jgi:hypothetical protein